MKPLDRERIRRLKAEDALKRARASLRHARALHGAAHKAFIDAQRLYNEQVDFLRSIARGLIGARATEAEISALLAKLHERHKRPRGRRVALGFTISHDGITWFDIKRPTGDDDEGADQ